MAVRVRFASPEEAREFAEAHRAIATAAARVVQRGELTLATQENGTVIALLEPVGRDVVFAIGTSAEVAIGRPGATGAGLVLAITASIAQ